jgi:type II secretory pathway pseudopilin PulG
MKLKTIIVTVAVLAVLSIVAYFARRPSAPASADARIGQTLVDTATINQAAKLRITDAGKTVLLDRQADGNWRVASYHDFPADFQKLSGFVGNLTDAKLQRLVTTNPDRIARLEFKDTKIELLDPADKVLWTVTLGKNPESGSGRFVQFGDEKKAYLANLSAWLDTESRNWAQAELINVKAEDVAKVEAAMPEGALVASRAKKEDPWTAEQAPEGQRVKADRISSLLSSIGNIRFSDTTDPGDPNVAAAKANLRTFKLTTFDNKTITVALGRKPEEKKLKPPTAGGPGSLGSLTDLAKQDEAKKDDPLAPEFETIPAGPVYAFVTHSDPAAPVNALMQKRAFQISEYTFTSLPQKLEEMYEPAPPAPPADAPRP